MTQNLVNNVAVYSVSSDIPVVQLQVPFIVIPPNDYEGWGFNLINGYTGDDVYGVIQKGNSVSDNQDLLVLLGCNNNIDATSQSNTKDKIIIGTGLNITNPDDKVVIGRFQDVDDMSVPSGYSPVLTIGSGTDASHRYSALKTFYNPTSNKYALLLGSLGSSVRIPNKNGNAHIDIHDAFLPKIGGNNKLYGTNSDGTVVVYPIDVSGHLPDLNTNGFVQRINGRLYGFNGVAPLDACELINYQFAENRYLLKSNASTLASSSNKLITASEVSSAISSAVDAVIAQVEQLEQEIPTDYGNNISLSFANDVLTVVLKKDGEVLSTAETTISLDYLTNIIPVTATINNKLVDYNQMSEFVNSSISTNTAYYISDNGQPFTSVEDLQSYSGTLTNNDYAFVVGTDENGNVTYTRYKYNSDMREWSEEYVLNNSSFTAAQWAAINSTINATLVASYSTHLADRSNPHNVTALQVGLGDVVNTGDSAIPVSGGTTKFTTGGAYIELNKKVDKTNSANKIYGTDANGNQTTYDKDSFGTQLNIENGVGTGSAHLPVQSGREHFDGLYGASGNDANENYPNPYIAVQDNKFTLDSVEYTINFTNGQPTTITGLSLDEPVNVVTTSGEKFATINGVKVEILYNASSQATSVIRYKNWTAGALGNYTFQWGGTSSAKNDRSAVGGTKNVVGYGAFAGGDTNYAANFGFVTGYKNYAGLYSLVAGTRNFGMASSTFLRGNENRAYAPYADMSGWDNVVTENGTHGRVSGAHNKVNAPYGDVTGSYNTVNGFFGRSYGGNNESNGDYATAGGQNTKADGDNSKTDGSRTHTIKEILKTTASSQKTLGLTVGKRYRFYGSLNALSAAWFIKFSSIENVETTMTSTTVGGEWDLTFSGGAVTSQLIIPTQDGATIYEGNPLYIAFNFVYASENVSALSLADIAELKSHIVEHPAVVLTKGAWYHFNGSLENQVRGIPISKVANLDTSSSDEWLEHMGQSWGLYDGALCMGNHQYGYESYADPFYGSFDFVYDGDIDIELTGEYAYYSEKITVSPLQTVDHNSYAGGAGTEAFGHAARSTGILTKAYGDGAVSEGGNTQAGVLVDLNVYSKAYDSTGDTYQTYLVPSVKYTHAGGLGTIATAEAQTVFGKYNKENASALFILGNGTDDNNRRNMFEALEDGTFRIMNFNSQGNVIGTVTIKCINGVLTVVS